MSHPRFGSERPDEGPPVHLEPKNAISRRELIQRSLAATAGITAAPLIAACGSSSSSSAVSSARTSSAATAAGLTSSDVATITKLIGPIDAAYAGKGTTWNVGAVLPLSGAGAPFGEEVLKGINLAVKHIAQLGGPTITMHYVDHKSGDPQAGIAAVLQYHDAGIGATVSTYGADAGAMLPGLARYQIMAIDQGGGADPPLNHIPFYWGARGGEYLDYFPIMFKYVKARMPSVKSVTLMASNFGPTTQVAIKQITQFPAQYGLKLAGVVSPPGNATNFSSEIVALRSQNADVIFDQTQNLDEAYFMKQYKASGINKPVFTTEYIAPTALVAGSAYEGMYFVQDQFNPAQPANPWADIFVRDYLASYKTNPKTTPDFYAAGNYSVMFAFWQLFRAVRQKGGNPNSGAELQDAMVAKPTVPVVFGGSSTAPGYWKFDPTEHWLDSVPIGLYQVRNGVPVLLATANRRGSDFTLVSS